MILDKMISEILSKGYRFRRVRIRNRGGKCGSDSSHDDMRWTLNRTRWIQTTAGTAGAAGEPGRGIGEKWACSLILATILATGCCGGRNGGQNRATPSRREHGILPASGNRDPCRFGRCTSAASWRPIRPPAPVAPKSRWYPVKINKSKPTDQMT